MINILLSRGIINIPNIYIYLKEYIKPHHKVLFVAFSFFEKDAKNATEYQELTQNYLQRMKDSFFPYGIKEEQIDVLNYYNNNHDDAVKMIKEADIIYFPGGAPDAFMKRLSEFKITEILEKASDKIFIGSSAGTMIQFPMYHITPDKDYKVFSYQKGLGLIHNFMVEVHYKKRFKFKKSSKRVKDDYNLPIIIIPDSGCVILDGDKRFFLGGARVF